MQSADKVRTFICILGIEILSGCSSTPKLCDSRPIRQLIENQGTMQGPVTQIVETKTVRTALAKPKSDYVELKWRGYCPGPFGPVPCYIYEDIDVSDIYGIAVGESAESDAEEICRDNVRRAVDSETGRRRSVSCRVVEIKECAVR